MPAVLARRFALLTILAAAGCSEGNEPLGPLDPPHLNDTLSPEEAIEGLVLDRSAPDEHGVRRLWANATRQALGNGVAHYQFDVPLGRDRFDVVRIHRVVRERGSFRPAHTRGAVFMTTGAALSFETVYLRPGTSEANQQTSAAVFLAANDVDVWGMDFAWALVPGATNDFSFMGNWGIDRDVDHTLAAMSIARLIRRFSGQGHRPMNLLGFSYGGSVAYAAAARESQERRQLRDVAGIIVVDMPAKFAPADESGRLGACTDATTIQAMLDGGTAHDAFGATLARFATLAETAPNEESPVFAPLTNRQAVLFIGTNTFQLGNPSAPFWHFVAGTFDDKGIPIGLLYSDPARWIELLGSLPPYMPLLSQLEIATSLCDRHDVSFDDHLGDIRVPILYVGAGGGSGTLGYYSTSLTASRDVTTHNVSVQPPAQRMIDYGHGDLFLGIDAKDRVWRHLLSWLVDHAGSEPRDEHTTCRRRACVDLRSGRSRSGA